MIWYISIVLQFADDILLIFIAHNAKTYAKKIYKHNFEKQI